MGIFNKILMRIDPVKIIEKSELFDSHWYSEKYNIIRNPAKHYLFNGYKQGCEPSKAFSGHEYHLCNPDTKIMNPLLHYEVYGRDENRILRSGVIGHFVENDKHKNFYEITKSFTYRNKINKKIRKCVIFASYSLDNSLPDYVVYYLKELSKVADTIIFVADNYLKDVNEAKKIYDFVDYAEFDRHTSYDFGSYLKGIEFLKENDLLKDIEELYLINDSCYGPVAGFNNLVDSMSKIKCDFWGLLDSTDGGTYHLLSFFYCFKNKVINDPIFYNFFKNNVIKNMTFDYAVFGLERKLTDALKQKYSCGCFLSNFCDNSLKVIAGNQNATVWPLKLLKNNFPLVKIKALDGRFGNDLHDNADEVLEYVRTRNSELYKIIIDDLNRRKNKDIDKYSFNCFAKMESKKIISFDVFDTLVIRPFASPVDLFNYIEKKYNAKEFAINRVNAEERARSKYCELSDINIDEIYEQMPRRFSSFKKIEIEEEFNLCMPNPDILELYNNASNTNAEIIAISDMYLSGNIIKKLLWKNGFTRIKKVFVSCDIRKTKGDGSLYRYVSETTNVRLEDMMHIGDNEISDIERAKDNNVDTYKIEKVFDSFLYSPASVKYRIYWDNNQNLKSSVHLSMLSIRNRFVNNRDSSFFKELGYSLGGPLALGYVDFICRRASKNGIDKLVFAARDGYLLKKVYDNFFKAKYGIASEYAYLTRAVILGSTLNYYDDKKYLKTILLSARKSIKNINVTNDYQNNKREFEKNKQSIEKWARKNKNNLSKHLLGVAGKSKNIAIVDMTTYWYTSLIGAREIIGDRVKMGFFTGAFSNKTTISNETYSIRLLKPEDSEVLELSEELISSPEPSIIFVNTNGEPVYQTKNEDEREKRFLQINEGIEEYVEDFIRCFGVDNCDLFSFEDWLKLAAYYKRFLNDVDKKELLKIKHSVNPLEGDVEKKIVD